MSSRDDAPAPRETTLPVVDLGFGNGAEQPAASETSASRSGAAAQASETASPVPEGAPPAPVATTPETAVQARAPEASAEKRVREMIRGKELVQRRRIGERTLRRVGRRSWERPNVCFSDRLFKRLGANDPWDPDGRKRESKPIGLGPVGLKLGDKRRQPAPHLRPKMPKGKKKPAQAVDPIARFRNLPPAPSPSPAPAPRPAPRPPAAAPPRVEPPRSASGRATNPAVTRRTVSGEFGGSSGPKPLVGKLPMRPELAAGAEPAQAEGKPARAPARPAPTGRAAAASSRPGATPRGGGRSTPPRAAPTRTAPKAASAAPADAPRKPVRPPPPRLPGPPGPGPKKRTNRFRMKPTEARGPVVREKTPPPVKVLELVDDGNVSVAPAPSPAPVNRSAPKGPLGLDDLFGGGGGEGFTRMRVRRTKKKADSDD